MTKILDSTGKNREISDIVFIEKLMKMTKEQTPWDVFDEIVSWYMKKYANTIDTYTGMTFNQYIENNKEHRKHMVDPKLGRGKEKIGRMLLSIPQRIIYMFQKLYPDIFAGSAKDQKEFMHAFAERYPQFMIPEKI